MICQICNQREATIHLTSIINGETEEKHICESCANVQADYGFNLPFSLNKLFTSLLGSFHEEENFNIEDELICEGCGLTYSELMEVGKFGCGQCYEVFEKDIRDLLKGIHGHSIHKGKIPTRIGSKALQKREVESLREKLNIAVSKEEFEEAAKLRDEINRIDEELNSSKE